MTGYTLFNDIAEVRREREISISLVWLVIQLTGLSDASAQATDTFKMFTPCNLTLKFNFKRLTPFLKAKDLPLLDPP